MIYRAPRKGDLDGFLALINELADEDTYIMTGRQTRVKERKWLDEKLRAIRKRNAVMVVAESGGGIIGNCMIQRRSEYPRTRHAATLGISVLKAHRGRGTGKELMRRATALAKRRMGVKLLMLTFMANNPVASGLYRKLGFREFGRCPKAFWFKGKYVDEIYMYKSP